MAEEEQTPAPTPSTAKKASGKRKMILIVLTIVSAVVLKLGVFLLFIGMLPAIVAYEIDNTKHKFVSSTVAAFNFSGVLPDVMQVFIGGGTYDILKIKMLDPLVWMIMYGSAGMGWCMVVLSPVVASTILDSIYAGRILHLEGLQKRSIEDWGNEVQGKTEPQEEPA